METDAFMQTIQGMSTRNMSPRTAMKLHMLFAMCVAWAYRDVPKYQHHDPATSEPLLCDQCPPGTAVSRHCTASGEPTVCQPCPRRRFAGHWHWGDSCQHCTAVCKERQLVRRECNSTHDRVCECEPGYHLVVEFCVRHTACPPGSGVSVLGTPDSDTVCEECRPGFFSSMTSATEPCQHHRNCSQLGLKTARPGSSAQDTACEGEYASDCSPQDTDCYDDITLCEDAIFQFLLSPLLPWAPVERLLDSLPGRRVDWKNLEHLKKSCTRQQQVTQVLRLWREQNKDQDKLYSIIQGMDHCERKVSRCTSLKNMTLYNLLALADSLPGERVSEEAVRALTLSCPSQRHVAQLLHLWKSRNEGQDLAKALAQSLRELRSRGVPRPLLRTLKRLSRVIGAASTHRAHEKIFVGLLRDDPCFKSKPYND
ncbi:tumor necrosis factor receptor superfamily member 11B-like [Electrophorus electricus]|uniref:tumor necrosis factor receptor superfamily member 11B-like n=1 Tax=Electrophorus electricus TaxID=8005 RepID=UPI0015CF97B5|nr:tumor necrosis factor receptor superfamily member 11B-like [Electrophorus electricus]